MAETEKLNLMQKLALIGKPIKIMKKSKSGYNYTYVPEEELLAGIQDGMEKYQVSLIPSIVPNTSNVVFRDTAKTKTARNGTIYEEKVNENIVYGEMMFTWIDNENPTDRLDVPWFFIGQQGDSSQAYGSALTYAARYFKLQYFQVATANDPDAIVAKKKELAEQEEKQITSDIISEIDRTIKDFLKENENKRDDIGAIVSKHVIVGGKPSINYNKITSSVTAANLLSDIKNYINGEVKE